MKQLLIYDRPVPLDRRQHRNLRLHAMPGDFGFAAGINSVPLAAAEFARAACEYPIVFAGTGEDVLPAALLGLRGGENLSVDADGRWLEGGYVPAFLRRYPFVLAEKPGAADGFTVCLDAGYPGLGEERGDPLFTGDGGDSPLLGNALRFLEEYQAHLQRTRAFTRRLHQLELLQPRRIRVQPAAGEAFNLDGLAVVDEARLRALKGKPLLELLRSGDLGWIHVHLMSLVNIERLSRRMDARAQPSTGSH